MSLSCEGWYTLLCKRIKDEQSIGQDVPFTLISALQEGHFNDGVIKSSEGEEVNIHLSIVKFTLNYTSTVVVNFIAVVIQWPI